MLNQFKIPVYNLNLATAISSRSAARATILSTSLITSIISPYPAQAFVVNFTNLDDLDDSSSGSAFPPNSIDQGNFESDTQMFFFQEQSNLTLTSDLSVDANVGNQTYNNSNNVTATISSGTEIDSYYFSFDILNTSTSSTSNVITIEFSQPILGLIYLGNSLDNTDSILSRTGITYPTDPALIRGVENDPGITWNSDNVSLSAQLRVNNNSVTKIDHFRVVTAAEPIPFEFSPGLGLFLALGLFSLPKIILKIKSQYF